MRRVCELVADGLYFAIQGLLYVAEKLGADLDGGIDISGRERSER